MNEAEIDNKLVYARVSIQKDDSGDYVPTEHLLFHGTDKKTVERIALQVFVFEYAQFYYPVGKHFAKNGKIVYLPIIEFIEPDRYAYWHGDSEDLDLDGEPPLRDATYVVQEIYPELLAKPANLVGKTWKAYVDDGKGMCDRSEAYPKEGTIIEVRSLDPNGKYTCTYNTFDGRLAGFQLTHQELCACLLWHKMQKSNNE
jgi:hypothetical protein